MYVSMSPLGFRGFAQVNETNLVVTNFASNALGDEGKLFLESFGFSATDNELMGSVLLFVELFELGKESAHKSKNKTKRKQK